jgi:predicted ATPase/DNA-binding CsgD family transcriptional regulator
LPTSRRYSGNLPAVATAFVGRSRELSEVRQALSAARLVTLTGVGGVGKTRLALHAAADLRRAFPDGVWLVELAPLDDQALVAQTVATTIGVQDQSVRWPVTVLSDHLSDKHLLLILDNCEHLLDACAVLADALLEAAADLRILATSRQPLGLVAEQTVLVPPLAVPDSGGGRTVGELAEVDAVNLFVTRAGSVLPGFQLTEGSAPAVAALCTRLDGVPLAIELAVTRLRALSPEQVLDRLDERFQLLTGGSRAAMPRQQTLRALVDWSYALCSPEERELWARVSVFAGSFDLAAAEQVCGDDTLLPPDALLDAVTGLVEKSVLLREEPPSGVRYRVLETIRQYGRERLAERGDVSRLRARHRDHYLALAELAGAVWFGRDGPGWVDRMRTEHPNVRVALDFCVTGSAADVASGLRLASALWFSWRGMSLLGEGRQWLDRLLAAEGGTPAAAGPARARGLWVTGSLAVLQGDMPAARTLLEEGMSLAGRLRDTSAQAYAATFLGQVALSEGDPVGAAALVERGLAAHRAADDPVGTALALVRLALIASALGDAERAGRLAAEYISLCQARGAGWLTPFGHFVLAVELWHRGNAAAAVEEARTAVRAHWAGDDSIGVAEGVEVLAWAAAAEGRAERAACLLGALDRIWRAVGAPLFGIRHLVAHREECVARIRVALGDAAFAAAVERGSRLRLHALVGYALEEPAARGEPDGGRPAGDRQPAGAAQPGQQVRPEPAHPESGHPEPGKPIQPALTRREQEVADLVARGLSNKEIASSLVIAQRTAETHVEHVLAKLGFTSRAQIASWVTARRTRRS